MNNIVPFTNSFGTQNAIINHSVGSGRSTLPDGYATFADGIYQIGLDGSDVSPSLICSPFLIEAVFSDQSGKGWGILVSVQNCDKVWNDIPITNLQIARSPAEVIGQLVDAGLELASDKGAKERFLKLIKTWKPSNRLITVTQMGWVDAAHTTFVAGDEVIGKMNVLPRIGVLSGLTISGSAESWKVAVGAQCCGNPNMILAVSLALSGPLLSVLGTTGGGLHFRGASSSGKTTLLNLAASVWGSPQLVKQWRATSNGLEGIAAALNDMLLPLDEIAEISARALPETIYMLANGVGKARMNREAQLTETPRWNLAVISSGEISIEEKLQETGRGHMAGQEVRLIDVEADNRTYGVFDNLHAAANGAAFSDQIKQGSKDYHGMVGRAFVAKIVDQIASGDITTHHNFLESFQASAIACISGNVDGQIARVAHRFGVLALAGHLATEWGLTGWEEQEAHDAAMAAFLEWHDRRFGAKKDNLAKFILLLQEFLTSNVAMLSDTGTPASTEAVVGWYDNSRIYLSPECWNNIFPGTQGSEAAVALIEAGLMLPGDGGRHMCKGPRAIPGRPRLYTLNKEKLTSYRIS